MSRKPKNTFQRIEKMCIARGASIRRATKTNPFRHHVSGFVIRDVEGQSEHWQSLDDIVFPVQIIK